MNKSEEIFESLAGRISSGELRGRLPAEQKLAREYGVSPVTAAKALNLLRDKGLVRRVHGSGTYVNAPDRITVRIRFNGYFAEKLLPLRQGAFPQVEIQAAASMEEADAVLFPTTIPFFPGEYFLPWPRERIERLKNSGRLFPQSFEFHNVRGAVWGVPYLFSPDILFYNKKIMRQIAPDFEPYRMTFEEMLSLQEKLSENIHFFCGGRNQFLLSLIYNLAGNGVAGPEIFRKAVEVFSRVRTSGVHRDFLAGKALFSSGYRSMTRAFSDDLDVLPMPLFNGKRVCHAASEVFMVRNTTAHPELLFDLAESLFHPDLQRMIGSLKMGIPTDKGTAAETMDSSCFRDDIFLNEVRNVDYAHRHMSDSVCLCFSTALKRLVCDAITPEELLEEVEESYRFEEKRRQALNSFMVNSAAVDF